MRKLKSIKELLIIFPEMYFTHHGGLVLANIQAPGFYIFRNFLHDLGKEVDEAKFNSGYTNEYLFIKDHDERTE